MRPSNLKTKIFLDSGDSGETEEIIKLLGFLDGQTTNPTLIAKNPEAQARLRNGNKFSRKEALAMYRHTVEKISSLIPNGSVSVEVCADQKTRAEEMLKQGREMFSWIPNAHVKFPTTKEGLRAACGAVKDGMRVNMTLVFNQEQAAAVHKATKKAKKGDVFISPFIGRLDDRGERGLDLVANILRMYRSRKGHIEVLTASVRNLDHFLEAIRLGSDIITSPFKILREWADRGLPLPDKNFAYNQSNLKPIAYKELSLDRPWQKIKFSDELIDRGVERFAQDWNAIIG